MATMRYEVVCVVGGTSKRSHVFNLSSTNTYEVEKEVRRYYNISSSTKVEIISIRPE